MNKIENGQLNSRYSVKFNLTSVKMANQKFLLLKKKYFENKLLKIYFKGINFNFNKIFPFKKSMAK